MDALRIPDRLAAHLPGRLGDRSDKPVVTMVRLHGVITATTGPVPRSVINIAALEKTLERAFAPERLTAVALLVNSPGGSATQSALVADRVRGLAEEKAKEVGWRRGLQARLHEMFQQWVVDRRGDRLHSGAVLFTGEVWTGSRA